MIMLTREDHMLLLLITVQTFLFPSQYGLRLEHVALLGKHLYEPSGQQNSIALLFEGLDMCHAKDISGLFVSRKRP